jgi:ketosteroid isomerase-like protein
MSQENVDLVLALQPAPDVDLAHLFRDDTSWAALTATLGPALTRDFDCVTLGFPGNDGEISAGIEGLRATFLEWLEPWESYRTEIEEAMDLGDRVVVLVRDFGRRVQQTNEVSLRSAAVWTVDDGKVRRIEFCADRATALEAVGLSDALRRAAHFLAM